MSCLRATLVFLCLNSIFRTEAQIPISLLYKMKDVTTAEDFAQLFGNTVLKPGKPGNGDAGEHEEAAIDPYEGIAEFGKCEPRAVPIDIPRDRSDPNVFHWPPCVDLHRCGGCCTDLFECVATETEEIEIKVFQAIFDNESPDKLPIRKIQTFRMLNETACNCGCRTKKEDCDLRIHEHDQCTCKCRKNNRACSPRFRWSNQQCQCVCAASENQKNRCIWDNRHVWDEDNCFCGCKRVRFCPHGKTWDEEKCKCATIKPNCSPKKCVNEKETFSLKSCRCEHPVRVHPDSPLNYAESSLDGKKELT